MDGPRDPATGKRRQIPRSGFRTREEAEAARTKELAALNAGTWSDDQGVRIAAWLDQWLEELAVRGRSPKTLSNYRGHVRDVWRPHSTCPLDLRSGRIDPVDAQSVDQGRPGAPD